MAVEEEVGGVESDVVARHVPDTLVLTGLTPRILDEIVGLTLFVKCLAVDEHHMVIGEAPVVPLLLTRLLCGRYIISSTASKINDRIVFI